MKVLHIPRFTKHKVSTKGLDVPRPLGHLAVKSAKELLPKQGIGTYFTKTSAACGVVLIVLSMIFPMLNQKMQDKRYSLSPEANKVVGSSVSELVNKLQLDPKTAEYKFNNNYQVSSDASSIKPGQYKASLATKQDHSITIDDPVSNITIKFMPKFSVDEGKKVDSHILFPATNSGAQIVYSLKANGLKEDIVLPHYQGDDQNFGYELVVPAGVEARVEKGGDIGIYGGDPVLFGSITASSDADQAKLDKARLNSPKTNLLFSIPAPIVKDKNGMIYNDKAYFKLSDKQVKEEASTTTANLPIPKSKTSQTHYSLIVTTKNLKNLSYPISIDPSLVVTSANDFNKNSYNENIDYDASNNLIKRGALTGGTVSNWAASSNTFAGQINYASGALYNGHFYVLGGAQGGGGATTNVYMATLNGTGDTTGGWSALTSLGTSRLRGSTVIYNGFIYELGGDNGSLAITNVEYAKLSSNGTIPATGTGTWTAPGNYALPAAVTNGGAFAANGYIYYIGGGSAPALFPVNTVYYAKINADGTLTAPSGCTPTNVWCTGTNSLLHQQQDFGLSYYNGYVYLVGAVQSGGTVSEVDYAKVKSDGTIGAWTATTSLPAARRATSTVVANGYIYSMSGIGTGSPATNATVYCAPINGNGTVGTWQTTTSQHNARSNGISIYYQNYIYTATGYDGGGNNGQNDFESAPINTAGALGSYSTSSNTFSTSRFRHASVAYNGYLYVFGGINSSNVVIGDSQYAPINSDGTLGAWATTGAPSSSPARWGAVAVAYDGNIYLTGGVTSTNTSLSTVEYIGVSSSGTLGASWSTANGITGDRYLHQAVVYNDYLFVMGGRNNGSTIYNDVWYAQFSPNGGPGGPGGGGLMSDSGCGSTWCSAGSAFTTGRYSFAAATNNGYLYIMGGYFSGALGDVQFAKFGANGSLVSQTCPGGGSSTWCTLSSSFTTSRSALGGWAWNGYLYINGGCSAFNGVANCSNFLNDTQLAQLGSNGDIVGSWASTTSFTSIRSDHASINYHGFTYLTGGCSTYSNLVTNNCSNVDGDTQYAVMNNGGPGGVTSWIQSTSTSNGQLNLSRYAHSTVIYNGWLYVAGGCTPTCGDNSVEYTQILADGSIGTWTKNAVNNLPSGRFSHAAVVNNGYMYLFGGTNGSNVVTNEIIYAKLPSGGGDLVSFIGSCGNTKWCTNSNNSNPNMNTARAYLGGAVYNNTVYAFGGCTDNSCNNTPYLNTAEYASLNPNTGTVGSWTTVSETFPVLPSTGGASGRAAPAATAYNGYLYVMGGCSYQVLIQGCANVTATTNQILYAKLNANGSLSTDTCGSGVTWCQANTPSPGRMRASMVAANGYMYLVGGYYAGGANITSVQYAPIMANGVLGKWEPGTAMPTALAQYGGLVAYSGNLYFTGGESTGTPQNNTYYTGQASIQRKGTYIRLFDMDKDVRPTKLILNGSKHSDAALSLTFTNATDSGLTFNNLSTNLTGLSFATNYSLDPTTPHDPARYNTFTFNLDDSQSSIFPDANSTALTVNDLTFYFNTNASRRLRNGKSFINEAITGVNAQP